jgi:hypothetical protein
MTPMLDGITVLDFATVGPAARASRWLADYGADVVKVGAPPRKSGVQIEPPFYAYTLRCGITFTYLATKVDEQMRMGLTNGGTSPNMYAAGEIMAGNVLDKGYLAGLGMTIGSVFGRIAGREASTNAK